MYICMSLCACVLLSLLAGGWLIILCVKGVLAQSDCCSSVALLFSRSPQATTIPSLHPPIPQQPRQFRAEPQGTKCPPGRFPCQNWLSDRRIQSMSTGFSENCISISEVRPCFTELKTLYFLHYSLLPPLKPRPSHSLSFSVSVFGHRILLQRIV